MAAATVADVVARWWVNYDGTSVGLRGGTWSYSGDGPVVVRLQGVRLVPRVPVSGVVRWYPRKGEVRAEVSVRGPQASLGRCALGGRLMRSSGRHG